MSVLHVSTSLWDDVAFESQLSPDEQHIGIPFATQSESAYDRAQRLRPCEQSSVMISVHCVPTVCPTVVASLAPPSSPASPPSMPQPDGSSEERPTTRTRARIM